MVYAASMRILCDRHLAEDAVQATFLVLARKCHTFSEKTVVAGWLFRTAVNTSRNVLTMEVRRKRRERAAAKETEEMTTPEEETWEEMRPVLDSAVASLPAGQRDAVVLRYMEGKSREEIAEQLGASEETIHKRLVRGLRKLRAKLGRKGVAVSGALLATFLAEKTVEAAPAGLAASVSAVCAGTAAASGGVTAIANGVIKAMLWAKIKAVAAVATAATVVGVGVPVTVNAVRTPPAPAPVTGELRGVWIHSPGYFTDWDGEMKRLSEAGINAVFLNVCDATFGHYKSDVLPATSGYYQKTKTDWVKTASEACRKHGLQFHAWRLNFKGVRDTLAEGLIAEGRIQTKPDGTPYEWKGLKGAYWLCPAHPENVELEAAAMAELAERYDIDGVHMDFIRFPQTNSTCFCLTCRDYFLKKTGLPRDRVKWPEDAMKGGKLYDLFLEAKQDHVTNVVRAIHERVRAANPNVRISAAVFSSESVYAPTVGQAWLDWIDREYLDFVCPMDFETKPGRIHAMAARQLRKIDGRIPCYVGITMEGVSKAWWLVVRLNAAREAGADGFVIFQYRGKDSPLGRMLPGVSKHLEKAGEGDQT
jgi:RNA polymerase sigma factor (sigma-70 family)